MKIFIYPKRHTHGDVRLSKNKDGAVLFTLLPGGFKVDTKQLKIRQKQMQVNTYRFSWLFWSFARVVFKKSKR